MPDKTDIETLIRFIVTSLVDEPDKVVIERRDTDSGMQFEIQVAPDDTGKVIGRQGRIIKALRVITRAAGSLDDQNVDVEILG